MAMRKTTRSRELLTPDNRFSVLVNFQQKRVTICERRTGGYTYIAEQVAHPEIFDLVRGLKVKDEHQWHPVVDWLLENHHEMQWHIETQRSFQQRFPAADS